LSGIGLAARADRPVVPQRAHGSGDCTGLSAWHRMRWLGWPVRRTIICCRATILLDQATLCTDVT